MKRDGNNLKPGEPRGLASYYYRQFHEEAVKDAARRIISNASPRTRPYFDRGPNEKGEDEWAAMWFLYHLFRYRDPRNQKKGKKNRRPIPEDTDDSGEDDFNGCKTEPCACLLYEAERDRKTGSSTASTIANVTRFSDPRKQMGKTTRIQRPGFQRPLSEDTDDSDGFDFTN